MFKQVAMICLAGLMATPILAQPIGDLMEQAAYQEVTVGDLKAAATIYEKVVSTRKTDRAAVAKALYRLSVCYSRLGFHDQSRDTLNTLVNEYPNQTKYAEKAVRDLGDAQTTGLTLNSAPWESGETIQYGLKGHGGADLGMIEYTANSVETSGVDVWEIEAYTVIPLNDTQVYLRIEADSENFSTLNSRVESNQVGNRISDYTEGAIAVSVNDAIPAKTITTKGVVYDNEQLIHLMRRLPLQEGYKTQLTVYEAMTNSLTTGELTVLGSEVVTVDAGVFDTFKVSADFSGGNHPLPKSTLWVAKDSKRHVVKFQNKMFVAELGSTRNISDDERALFEYSEAELSLRAPEGWRLFDAGSPSPNYDTYLYAVPPEMGAWALFVTRLMDTESMPGLNIDRVVKGDISAIQGFLKKYKLRENSPFDLDAKGLPAKSFIGDYVQEDKAMVEYRTYLLGKKGIYWFVFRVETEEFEKFRPQFDSMIASFEAS